MNKICTWYQEQLEIKGQITKEEMDAHRKTCPICQEVQKRILEDVDYDGGGINYNPRWQRPKCPFCFSDIPVPEPWYLESDGNVEDFDTGEKVPAGTKLQGGYKIMKCPDCGASYSADDTDNEEMAEEIENLNPDGLKEIQTFIYHNYSVEAHAFSNYWIDMVDLFEPEWNLCHLWFVRVRDGKYDLDTKPRQSYESEKEIKEVVKILDSTKGAFKSKKVQEARERLEKIIN